MMHTQKLTWSSALEIFVQTFIIFRSLQFIQELTMFQETFTLIIQYQRSVYSAFANHN